MQILSALMLLKKHWTFVFWSGMVLHKPMHYPFFIFVEETRCDKWIYFPCSHMIQITMTRTNLPCMIITLSWKFVDDKPTFEICLTTINTSSVHKAIKFGSSVCCWIHPLFTNDRSFIILDFHIMDYDSK